MSLPNKNSITSAEWRWVLIASVLIVVLSSIPYAAGYLAQTPDQVFGGAAFDRMDYNVHLASIITGQRGEWAYPILHTHEAIPPSYVKLFYIFLGQLGRVVPLPPDALYQVARVVCGLWMLLIMYVFAARFIWPVALRRLAFLFFALGSGLGWLMFALKWQPESTVSPIDFWLIDLYGFFALLTFPHFAAIFALLWWGMLAFLDFQRAGQWRDMIIAIVAALLILFFQPFTVGVIDVVLGSYAVASWVQRRRIVWRELSGLSVMALSQVPLLSYAALTFWGDATWQSSSQQLIMLSPSPLYYVLGVGLIGALAVIGAWRVISRAASISWLLVIWVVAVTVLIYLPTQFQRRFTEGVWAPLSVLAALGVGTLLPHLRRGWQGFLVRVRYPYPRARGLALMLLIVVTAASSLYLNFGSALLAATRAESLFNSADMLRALAWLQMNADSRATIFASEKTGNVIPARIGQRVYLGHPVETANYEVKVERVKRFFSTMTSAERVAALQECACRFVFYSPSERALGAFDPETASYLKRVYESGVVRVYEVVY